MLVIASLMWAYARERLPGSSQWQSVRVYLLERGANQMRGLLEGKVAIITGAGSGVGRQATILFAQHGAKVMASDINLGAVEESAALAKKEGGVATATTCDVADATSVARLFKAAVDAYGRVDVVYNNAGITLSTQPGKGLKTLVDTSDAEMAKVIAVNFNGVAHGCQEAIKQFDVQGGGGVIVNTASVAGLIGFGGVAYGASKGAVVSLTRTLAIEVAAKNIRINSVCPSGMLTHFAGLDPDGAHADKINAGMGSLHPGGRAITAHECAKAALFLASDLASGITGVNLPVDSGLSAGIQMRK
jgi:NAD(P)-dependent dehydrogenase (short-subunit alcohol dehydrogenase family)